MVIIQVRKSFLTPEQLVDVKEKMVKFFSEPVGSVRVSALYMSTSTQDNSKIDSFEHLSKSRRKINSGGYSRELEETMLDC